MLSIRLQNVSGEIITYQLVEERVIARDLTKDDAEAIAALWTRQQESKPQATRQAAPETLQALIRAWKRKYADVLAAAVDESRCNNEE